MCVMLMMVVTFDACSQQILPPRDEDKDPVEVQIEQPTEDV